MKRILNINGTNTEFHLANFEIRKYIGRRVIVSKINHLKISFHAVDGFWKEQLLWMSKLIILIKKKSKCLQIVSLSGVLAWKTNKVSSRRKCLFYINFKENSSTVYILIWFDHWLKITILLVNWEFRREFTQTNIVSYR